MVPHARCSLLVILSAACALAEDRVAAAAKDDVEVALSVSADGKLARAIVDNRGACAKAVAFDVSFSIAGDPRHVTLTVPPGGQAGKDAWFPLEGSAVQADLKIV